MNNKLIETDTPISGGLNQQVTVERVRNGFIVRVGCQTFVFTTWEEVQGALGEYWADPKKAAEKYCK